MINNPNPNCDKEYYNEHFSFETCLDDWIVVHWAWSVDDDNFPR
jgi:hypothetical protein